ncbi:hypothetical protein Cs7R123_06880 [Catellatospora sp. TT07R-123]|uniref:hypothetical protein n=1 Tax=Catellatospora sp. TT07R-123 TaxID=2733863 RepID=UPI001B234074|nr:hypothetical protein [Catellatospora sp. TT07R-123]GHJ43346.1 hypothetical protein Cs7R123_06880 [Catellatospora sp. TT07R-123]
MKAMLERAGERLLAKLVPNITANAVCTPYYWCEECPHSGGRRQLNYYSANCTVSYGTCYFGAC